jgi:hypothetical protein
MRRMQTTLTDEEASAIEAEAAASGRTPAAILRDAVRLWWRSHERRRRIQRAMEVTGGFQSGLGDVSERHDDYLMDDLEEEMRERWR